MAILSFLLSKTSTFKAVRHSASPMRRMSTISSPSNGEIISSWGFGPEVTRKPEELIELLEKANAGRRVPDANTTLKDMGVAFLEQRGFKVWDTPVHVSTDGYDSHDTGMFSFDTQLQEGENVYNEALTNSLKRVYKLPSSVDESSLPLKFCGKGFSMRSRDEMSGYTVMDSCVFEKVNQFAVTKETGSSEMTMEMTNNSVEFMKLLKLPHQVVKLFLSQENSALLSKYEVRLWYPRYNKFFPVASAFNMGAKYAGGIKSEPESESVHYVNAHLFELDHLIQGIIQNYSGDEYHRCFYGGTF